MRRVAVATIFVALFATVAGAQKVMVPAQSSNPNVLITPPPAADQNLDKAKRVDRDEAIKLVKENKAVFVDVRSKESYDAGHIKGAISIPESQLVTHMRDLPLKKMIITYCA
jgi:3-mercaptopyruvate sulfurtransferase SseA